MEQLSTYAALAEIFGVLAIVFGGIFAAVQLSEYRIRRKNQVAVDLCGRFTEPEFGRAISLIRRLPDGIAFEDLQAMDTEYQESAQIVGMAFETMGLLVFKKIASFQMTQQLTGGLLLMIWRKEEIWIKGTRAEQSNPRFGEWMQWLAERLQECEEDMVPAYEAHSSWDGPHS